MWCANPRLYRQVPGVFPLAGGISEYPGDLRGSSQPLYFSCQRSFRRERWASLFPLRAQDFRCNRSFGCGPRYGDRQALAGGAGLTRSDKRLADAAGPRKEKEICLGTNAQTDLQLLRYAIGNGPSQGRGKIFRARGPKSGAAAHLTAAAPPCLECSASGPATSSPR